MQSEGTQASKARPILFSAPMVRALLAGTKTQTRRVVKGWPLEWLQPPISISPGYVANPENHACPYGQPGDRLWVRESLGYCSEYGHYYAADRTFLCSVFDDEAKQTGYSYECDMREGSVPSIHLPRKWSRITLAITRVRVERLQDISPADCQAEGIPHYHDLVDCRRERYRDLWQEINGPGSWDANPWVWVVEFRKAPDLSSARNQAA